MAVTDGPDIEVRGVPDDSEQYVSALRASPDRTVFTEEGNCDGWIATDLTVELLR